MSKITYSDKEYIYENASIPEINKITDGNMNEIKTVVNENDTRLSIVETNQGTLANLTTTEKTNLVGAINEVDSNLHTYSEIVSVHPDELITMESGFKILDSSVCKQKNHYFGYITIKKSGVFASSQELVGKLKVTPKNRVNLYGVSGVGNDIWNIPSNFAYLYIGTNKEILIRGKNTDSYIKTYLDFLV